MKNNRKQKMMDLGADALADALLGLAVHSDEADDLIERLIATPRENVQRFKKKLSSLKRSRRFIDWRGSAGFARELEMLLQDLKSGVDDPISRLMDSEHQSRLVDEQIAEGIRSMPEQSPPIDFTNRVMSGLEPKKVSFWTRLKLWFTEPRSITFTPAQFGSAMAAVMIMFSLAFWFEDQGTRNDAPTLSPVRFVLSDVGMGAESVAVIGSFNGWQAEGAIMRFDENRNVWLLETQLPPGDYEYVFLVNGERLVPDPRAQVTRDDGFGNRNSIVFVDGDHEQTL